VQVDTFTTAITLKGEKMKRKPGVTRALLDVLGLVLIGGILAGCQTTADGSAGQTTAARLPANPLAGTKWRLVSFQSMDDAIGTVRPPDPSLYTMHLQGDGTVSMRLNCNRARGQWSAVPSGDGRSGRFAFEPLAMTRAICPPPSMDAQIAAQAGYIRGYLLKEGMLYLSLMADGGIYAWAPDD
jgi:heat shock protein HslJ